MSVLDRIAAKKRERVSFSKSTVPLRDLKERIADSEEPRDFTGAVTKGTGRIRFIAEIKKASPSRGVIRADFDVGKIARIYEEKAVDAVSVITEEDFFSGDLTYLQTVRQAVTRPVLRKDFVVEEYQIYESKAYGADAILLIAALLDRKQAEEYLHLGRELGLAVLFEVHDHAELDKALLVGAGIIGINNRDLRTLTVDLGRTFSLKKEVPRDRVVVSESGIRTGDDVVRLEQAGIDAILVGTPLMESPDIGRKIDELRGT